MIEPRRFREVLGSFPTGVVVVTALDEDAVVAAVPMRGIHSRSRPLPAKGVMATADEASVLFVSESSVTEPSTSAHAPT